MKNSNNDTDRLEEIKKGLKRTAPYILSHHSEENLDRCYKIEFNEREIHLCSRCMGIYTGITLAFISFNFLKVLPASSVFVLMFPTFLEKYMTDIKSFQSYNLLRNLNGVLLGFGYASGVRLFAHEPFNLVILLTGLFYMITALFFVKVSD